jgi:hypothetical protein
VISIQTRFMRSVQLTDRSVVSACPLGLIGSGSFDFQRNGSEFIATGLAGVLAVRPVVSMGRPVRVSDERPTEALEAEVAAAAAKTYALAATSAKTKQAKQQHHTMWAFRGLEPWSDPA